MKNLPLIVALCSLSVLIGGCSLQEKYDKNNAVGQAWVSSGKSGGAPANFEGVFYSPEWGAVTLNQDQGKIVGSIGHHHVSGQVSGRTARLLLIDDQWVEFTMLLERVSYEKLKGRFSPSVPMSEADASPVTLLRIDK